MKSAMLHDSTMALMSEKTVIGDAVSQQIRQSAQSFAPYYKPKQSVVIDAARLRQSAHSFGQLSLPELGELLHLSMFDTERPGARPYPAGGGIYTVSLYLAAMGVDGLPSGVHYVRWSDKALEEIGTEGEARELHDHVYQPDKSAMPVLAILAADTRVSTYKYRDIATRMAYIEAGALLQTMYLACTKLGLTITGLGGISDRSALKITKLEPSSELLFACGAAIGGALPVT